MKIVSTHGFLPCVVFVALWSASCASVASSAAGDSLTLPQALQLADSASPALAAHELQTEALSTRAELEALPPSFVIEGDFENFAGAGDFSGARGLETTLAVSRVIELGNKPALRRGVGDAELRKLTAVQQLRRVDLAAEVARRFIRVLADQETVNSARHGVQLAETAREVVRERVHEGASSPAALSRAEIALSRAQIELEHAEHELSTSRVKLSVLWGEEQPRFSQARGDLFALPMIEAFEDYQARLPESPELAELNADAQVQEAKLRLAEAQRAPDIVVAAGVRRLEAFDDQALVAGFAVPLGSRKRASLAQRAVRADRARVEMDREAKRLELHSALFDVYQEMRHVRAEAQSLHARVRPQAQAMLATTEDGYRAGRFSLLELADAQTQLLQVERDAIRAAAQFHALHIEIRRVTGDAIRTLEARRSP
jgi:outer membrane protein, heavy metal efflux system